MLESTPNTAILYLSKTAVLALTNLPRLSFLATVLPIIGIGMCAAWSVLTWGSLRYFKYLTDSAIELENYLDPPVKTLSDAKKEEQKSGQKSGLPPRGNIGKDGKIPGKFQKRPKRLVAPSGH